MTESCVKEILERICRGETIDRICKDEHMPHRSTVWKWVRYDPDFAELYFEAKKFQLDAFAEQIITIADESVHDIRMAYDRQGNPIPEINFEAVKRSELRVKTRQWLMERLMPKKYGDKVQHDPNGGNNQPINAVIQIMLPDNGRPIDTSAVEVVNGNQKG